MLVNFEDYTYNLTTVEVEFALQLAMHLEANKGNPVTADELCEYYNDPVFYPKPLFRLTPARVRKLVNYICKMLLPNLIGTSKGYFVSYDVEKLKQAAATLTSRANENQRRADCIYKHLTKTYGVKHGKH